MSKKQYFFNTVVILAVLLLAVSGCAPAAQPTQAPAAEAPAAEAPAAEAPAPAPAEEAVTLTIWTGYPELEPLYRDVADQFMATHPNVKFEFLSTTLREFETKLQAALPTGTGPDIFDVMPNITPILIEGELIDPNPPDVDALVKGGAYDEFTVNYFTFDGKTFGIPMLDGSKASLFYNKDMFKEAGLDPEKPPATFEEMMDFSEKLVKYDAAGNILRSGMSLRLSGQGSGIAEKFWFFLHNMGGDVIVPTADGTKWHNGYDNEAGQKALKFHIDAVHKLHVDDQQVKHDAEAFVTEQTAMFLREIMGNWRSSLQSARFKLWFRPNAQGYALRHPDPTRWSLRSQELQEPRCSLGICQASHQPGEHHISNREDGLDFTSRRR